jgi:hypothetical protein
MSQRGKKSAIYGEMVKSSGNGAPAPIEGGVLSAETRAGFSAERLDETIQQFICNAEASGKLIGQYGPVLATMLGKVQEQLTNVLLAVNISPPAGDAPPNVPEVFKQWIMTADDIARILERISKIVQNSGKGIDDLTRLRVFILGGDEDDGGLTGMGENQLRRMVLEAVQGWTKPVEE